MEWEIAGPEPEKCGASRGPNSTARCELPPDHVVGRSTVDPLHWPDHFGRSRSGRWFSWPQGGA
jgi:hypothetical protein